MEQFEKKTVKNRIPKTAPFPNKILRDIFNLFFQLFFYFSKVLQNDKIDLFDKFRIMTSLLYSSKPRVHYSFFIPI